MSENVIILGAGFSFNAGIPMLSGFIERMWEYSIRGKANGIELTENQKSILAEALVIRKELDSYHGRITFDDRNIEDILSMLSFNILGGGRSDSNKFKAFTKAISETIELSCNVKHPGLPDDNHFSIISDGNDIYRRFWLGLFRWYNKSNELPTIITFNYDLVLERSLFQVLINTNYQQIDNRAPFHGFTLDYKYLHFAPEHYLVNYTSYNSYKRDANRYQSGTKLEKIDTPQDGIFANIELLKLHGSLNFPTNIAQFKKERPTLTKVIENPYILPPDRTNTLMAPEMNRGE